ncbi:hypothetical protein HDU86_008335 [Geranomyces michiganensis]|nr:hypothetical protein HDU86_008335 [Geranomyces michiganensis]
MFTAGIVFAIALVATSVSAYGPAAIVPVYVDKYADPSCTGLPDRIDTRWGSTLNLDPEDVNLDWFYDLATADCPTVLREQYLVYSRFNEFTCTTGNRTGWGKPELYSHPPTLVRSLGGQCQPFAFNGMTLYRAATCAADGTARLKDDCTDKDCRACNIDTAVAPTCQNMGSAGRFDYTDEWVQGFCMTPVAGQWDSKMAALARGVAPPPSSTAAGATAKSDGIVERVGSMALVASSVVLLVMTLN